VNEQDDDLRVDTYRPAGGANGFPRSDVTVKITHIPTGLYGSGTCERGSYKVAKGRAMLELQRQLDWHYGPWL
jgi:protein subunit release factor A